MSRIINRLVEASGGWEVFLSKTLRDMCKDISGLYSKPGILKETKLVEILEEALEILEAYEETGRKGQPNQVIPTPQVQKDVEDSGKVEEIRELTESEMLIEAKHAQAKSESVEIKLEDIILTPAPRRAPKSRRLKHKLRVGSEVGGSQGDLPLPARHRIVDRQSIIITTGTGQQLGASSQQAGFQGQIQGKHVSGHVSVSGAYRLAFKDVNLGSAFIHFNAEPIPLKLTSKQFEEAIAAVNKLSVDELRERLEHFGMVYTPCKCGKEDCFGWKIIDQAVLEEAETQRKARLVAARNESSVGGMR